VLRLPCDSRFNRRNVDFLHRHHGIHCTLHRSLVRVLHRGEQRPRNDLPGVSPAVLTPAAIALDAAVVDDGVPIAIGFGLVVGEDLEADRFIGLDLWPPVQPDKRLTKHREFDRQLVSCYTAGVVGRGLHRGSNSAVGKHVSSPYSSTFQSNTASSKLLRFLKSEGGISNITPLFFMISPFGATPISVHRLVEG
jgi:hypothetical protein